MGTGPTAVASEHRQRAVRRVPTTPPAKSSTTRRWSRGQPASFPLNQVVPGFAQGIVGMKVGGRREIVIPSGARVRGRRANPPAVGPNETLVFVVDLVAIQ